MILGGVDCPLEFTILELILGGDGIERLTFGPQNPLDGAGGFGVGLVFTGSDGFVDDPRRLPGSFDEWQLDEAEFTFFFEFEDENGYILAKSTSYFHLSITNIPEPSSLTIAVIGILVPVLRRRREG